MPWRNDALSDRFREETKRTQLFAKWLTFGSILFLLVLVAGSILLGI